MKVRNCSTITGTLSAVLLLSSVAAAADSILFADIFVPTFDDGSIRRVTLDGSQPITIVPIGGGLRSLDVDVASGKIYWTDVNSFAIRRCNLNGSNVEDVITTGLAFPSAIAIDSAGGKLYWGDQTDEFIYRASLDGSGVEPLINTPFHRGLAIDALNQRLYWTTSITATTGAILRSDMVGGDMQVVVPPLGGSAKPGSLALDVAGGKIYWTDNVAATIRRANLDGSNVELLMPTQAHAPRGIRLDLVNQWIYWGQDYNDEPTIGRIMRMRYDGTFSEVVVWELGLVNDLLLVPDSATPNCPGDVNGDGAVDLADLATLLSNFGGTGGAAAGDIDGDGDIDLADLATLLANFGGTC